MVYGPLPKRTYKPRADVPAIGAGQDKARKPGMVYGHDCVQAAPCGGKCVLDSRHRHQLHSCNRPDCPQCHSPKRFGRMAA
jgi:hypothetical protein